MPSEIFRKDKTCCNFCLERSDIFSCLNQDELGVIGDNRSEVHFKAGELIFKQGTPAAHLLCLTKGMVKLYIEGYDNKNLIIGIVKPIEYILGPGIYVDSKHHYSAVAMEDSIACLVDANVFKTLIHTNPSFADEFIRKVSQLSIYNFEQFISLTQKQMPGRIADVILYLSERIYGSLSFTTTLSRQDIADMSGMSKESAIRILKEFKDEKIIAVEGNTFEILNLESLHKISQTG
ncbi:MAG TPA: Crp/Fnr family transcriptional regulator [Bacteroidales bacterium]|jgi:CRP/FNR family transcriptional regulator|nr:Crp/Fnr family transcriptional regulator [Bacteroidales bacterium]